VAPRRSSGIPAGDRPAALAIRGIKNLDLSAEATMPASRSRSARRVEAALPIKHAGHAAGAAPVSLRRDHSSAKVDERPSANSWVTPRTDWRRLKGPMVFTSQPALRRRTAKPIRNRAPSTGDDRRGGAAQAGRGVRPVGIQADIEGCARPGCVPDTVGIVKLSGGDSCISRPDRPQAAR
jgi:hypothetical protein